MSRRAGLLGGALSLLALLALSMAGLATASSPPGTPINGTKPGKITKVGQTNPGAPTNAPRAANAIGYRLTAKLAPTGNAPAAATGHWDGVLVHTVGIVKNGQMPSVPGCSVSAPRPGGPGQAPPRQSGLPHRIQCGPNGAVPPFTVPGSGNHWILGWKLTFDHLSSAVTSADIHIVAPAGSAPVAAANLCGTCVSGKFGRTTLTDDQANAILKGEASVVVSTANNSGGELSGQIVRMKPTAALHTK
jgi:CHRD domain-containing protein